MKKTKTGGRKKIGLCKPISITLTDEQRAWIESKISPGGTLTEVVRRIIENARRKEGGLRF